LGRISPAVAHTPPVPLVNPNISIANVADAEVATPEETGPAPATPKAKMEKPRKAGSKSSGKKAKKSAAGSNVFDMFTQKQVAEFKEGFQLMDHDKDGVLGESDLRFIFDEVGKIVTTEEIHEMLADAPSPINFTMLLNMFAERSSGEQDDDEVIAKAFKAFSDDEGLIDADNLRMSLITFGDKFTPQEADDALESMDIDDNGKVLLRDVVELITGTEVADENAEEAA